MTTGSDSGAAQRDWRASLLRGVRPYFERAPLAALFLGISSGFAFSMIGSRTLSTIGAQRNLKL